MEYTQLLVGIGIIVVWSFHLSSLIKRSGFANSLLRVDAALTLGLAVVLIVNSIFSIVS